MKTKPPLDTTGTLNNRQFKVLVLCAEELTIPQIADKFNLSHGWAKKELHIIYTKLGVHSCHSAIHKAWKLGIFTQENRK
ncbi:MAG TPA: LuxR C-terminal-related transcriptional regulator [Bacteroidia bacterium]